MATEYGNTGHQMTDPIRMTTARAAYPMAEAAHLLGVSRSHLYALRDRGLLRLVKLGHRTLVPASEIERLTTTTEEEGSSVQGRISN